jgi:hypothetical protein
MTKNKYRIIEGVKFSPYGERSLITNENLTDEIAELFIGRDAKLLGTVFEKNVATKEEVKKKKK